MSVGIESLFTSALGLQSPCAVGEVKPDTVKRRIDFEVSCQGSWLACPHCGAAEKRIHDRLRCSWRHLDFLQFKAWLPADVPRVVCTGCGKTTQTGVPWARDGSGYTALFEALAFTLCRELPVRKAAAMLRCDDKQLRRRIEHYVDQARALDDMSTVKIVGIDDTSMHRGHSYITVVHDPDAKRLLFATPGRDHQTVVDFAADLKAHGCDPEQVLHVCQDMSAAYTKGVGLTLPNAQINYNRFCVVALVIEVGHAQEPGPLVGQAEQCHALAAALGLEECARMAAKDGAAGGLRARRSRQQPAAGHEGAQGLAALGQTQPAGTIQETGSHDHRAYRRRRARRDRQPVQCFCRSHKRSTAQARRAARGFRTASTFIAIAYLPIFKLKLLPHHPFASTQEN